MKILILGLVLIASSCSKENDEPEIVLKDFIANVSSIENIQSDSFAVTGKKCSELACSLTYSVGYTTLENGKVAFVTKVEKVAEMVQVNDKWLIKDVKNVATFHDGKEPLSETGP